MALKPARTVLTKWITTIGSAAFTCNQLCKLIEAIAKGVHHLF